MINEQETKALAERMFDALAGVVLGQPQSRVAAAMMRVCAAVLPVCAQGGKGSDVLRHAAALLHAVADKSDEQQPTK